jgi:uncharacterized membrane protein
MDLTLLHPKIVHLPIALAVIMPFLSLGLVLAWWRDWLPKRAWIIAVILQGVLVASSYVAMETGEADEEVVEAVVAERFIDLHEEAAELFMWATALTLILFVVAGLLKNKRFALTLGSLSFVASVVVLGLGYRVGEAGGALVYEHGAASAHIEAQPANDRNAPIDSGFRDDDDDD